jgi:hypothetical protein
VLSANKIYGILAAGLVCWLVMDSSYNDNKLKQFKTIELDSVFNIMDKVLMDHEIGLERDSFTLDSLARIANVMKFSAFDVDMIMTAMKDHESDAIETAIELATLDSTIYRFHYIDSIRLNYIDSTVIVYDTIHEPFVVYDTTKGTGWKRKRRRK